MGVFTDLLASAKTFSTTSRVYRLLERYKAQMADPAAPSGYGAQDEVQSLAVYSGTVSGGTFTLEFTLASGETFTTAGILFSASAATIESAIDTAATSAGVTGWTNGDISVAGGDLNTAPVTFTFDGDSVDEQNHSLIIVDGASLTGGGSAGAVTQTTVGQHARQAWAVLRLLGVITDAAPPAPGDTTTAPTAGANLLRVSGSFIKEMAQEAAAEDNENAVYSQIVDAVLVADKAPLVVD